MRREWGYGESDEMMEDRGRLPGRGDASKGYT